MRSPTGAQTKARLPAGKPRIEGSAAPTAAALDPLQTVRLTKLIVFIDYIAVGAMRTISPFYAKSLGADTTGVAALETIYGVGQIVGALMLGKLSDTRGRKHVLLLSLLGSIVGYSLAGVAVGAGSASLLLLSRLPVGLAKQTVSVSRAIASDVTSEDQRSESLSALVGCMALGYSLGPVLGGLLVDHSPYPQLPAFLCAATFLALVPLVRFALPETRRAPLQTLQTPQSPQPPQQWPSPPTPPSATKLLPPAAPSAGKAASAWRQPGLLVLIAACALPEAAVIAGLAGWVWVLPPAPHPSPATDRHGPPRPHPALRPPPTSSHHRLPSPPPTLCWLR